MPTKTTLRIAVDIGGTFTDGIAHAAPGNRIWVAKCLTTPDDPGRAVSQIVDELLDTIQTDVGRQLDVTEVVHGTTLVTNTIIERSGARTGLLVTTGTRDVLDIARELRYDLYDLDLEIPQPLVEPERRREVKERLNAAGQVVQPLDESSPVRAVNQLAKCRLTMMGYT